MSDLGMQVVASWWEDLVKILRVHCSCGRTFEHPSDKWKICCPSCGLQENLQDVRGR